MTRTRAICVAAAILAGLAGCASPEETPPAASPSVSAEPSRPAQAANDKVKDPAWVVGTVTTGGAGPCYGLLADDGTQYALHSAAGTALTEGARMRVKTERAQVRIFCGQGKLVEMTAAEPLR
jgi:hypothetical protein